MDFDAPVKAASNPEIQEQKATAEQKAAEPKILSVSEVNKAVRSTLETNYRLLWIKGEISNFKAHSSGHWYFSLKDSKAQINAIMFRGFNQNLKFRPQDGTEVLVRGKITVYEPRGTYQIFCELMEPVGAGAMQLAFEQLKRKLELEGLFDRARKRPIPSLPRHVAVVTSPTGAAIRDILNILGRRNRGLRVTIVSALVQGDGAVASICSGIAKAERMSDVDVLIVGRGGGSAEDMWCFNDERVARAIAGCSKPVISAVGHEIDFTIADFVADLRAPTPSAAAELVCKNAAEISETLSVLHKRLARGWTHQLQLARQRMLHATQRLVDPKRRLQDLLLRCDELEQRLENAIENYLEHRRHGIEILRGRLRSPREVILRLSQQIGMLKARLESHWTRKLEARRLKWAEIWTKLDSISPFKVLARGYSITFKDKKTVTSVEQLKSGDRVEITFAKGRAAARVEEIL